MYALYISYNGPFCDTPFAGPLEEHNSACGIFIHNLPGHSRTQTALAVAIYRFSKYVLHPAIPSLCAMVCFCRIKTAPGKTLYTPLEEGNYAWQTYTFYTVYTGPLWDENCIRQIYTHALPVICEIETGLMNLYTLCWVFVEPNSTCKMYICISRHLWKGTLDESLQIVSCGIQTVSDKHMHMPNSRVLLSRWT